MRLKEKTKSMWWSLFQQTAKKKKDNLNKSHLFMCVCVKERENEDERSFDWTDLEYLTQITCPSLFHVYRLKGNS